MAKHNILDWQEITWQEVIWHRPFEIQDIENMLRNLAGISPRGMLAWEIRVKNHQARYFIGMNKKFMPKVNGTIKAHGNVTIILAEQKRAPVNSCAKLKIAPANLALNLDSEVNIQAILAAMDSDNEKEETVMQIILGKAISPKTVPKDLPDPTQGWLSVAFGIVRPAGHVIRKSLEDKALQPRFEAMIRIGTTSYSPHRINCILGALRTLESAGVKIWTEPESCTALSTEYLSLPWQLPLLVAVDELAALMLLPAGETEYQGAARLHPRMLMPPSWYMNNPKDNRCFAKSISSMPQDLYITSKDSLEHTHVIGPTGSGKSTVLLNLILDDIKANKSVLVIDPKADLVNDILARIPEERKDDVVVLDPADPSPVGFNPLAFSGYSDPALVTDAIISVFKEIYSDNFGIRSSDFFTACLMTLMQTKDANLLLLPPLLEDENFRKKTLKNLKGDIVLNPFWQRYEQLKPRERQALIEPVLNKMRQFLYRPALRNVLGQSHPKFNFTDLFYKRKIVLVPLNKGLIGSESARLIGSLIVGMTWTLALSRAKIPAEKRHIISIFIDELQDYVALPTNLSDALAQARGLGLGITMAHQYRAQLPIELRAGIDANTRNKIIFGLGSSDAKEMANLTTELESEDFMSLPRYHVYASVMNHGKSTGFMMGKTLPAPPAIRLPVDLKAYSQMRYGTPEQEITEAYKVMVQNVSQTDKKSKTKVTGDEVYREDGTVFIKLNRSDK